MRAIVIAFAVLAALKVWTQDRMVRAAMSEALIQAYRERAQVVCARETLKETVKEGTREPAREPAKTATAATAALWSSAEAAEITIGGKVARVMLWDYNNPLWDVRYRHPHLVLTAAGPRNLKCSYDLSAGVAFVQAL